MMKPFRIVSLVAFSLAGFAATVAARQTACTLTAESAPEVRGLRLGTPLSRLRERFPGARFGEDRFGLVAASLDRSVLQSGENATAFQGVSGVYLWFVDERLRKFEVKYLNSIHWETNDQFAARVSEALKLPVAWEGSGDGPKEMPCVGFKIGVHRNAISYEVPGAFDAVTRREKEKRERERRSFEP
jgi:hypothetical protein